MRYWFTTLGRELGSAVEESCDDRAAEILGSDSKYLKGLAEVATRGMQPSPLGFEAMTGIHLHHRFRRFLYRRQQ